MQLLGPFVVIARKALHKALLAMTTASQCIKDLTVLVYRINYP